MNKKQEKLSDNLEDYLEAISSLSSESGTVRPSDIAAALKVKKPSVTAALNSLAEKGLVAYEKYKPVSLTKDGAQVATQIMQKHKVLSEFFTDVLGVDASEADVAACKMEHSLNDGILKRLMRFVSGLGTCDTCPSKKCARPEGDCFCPHAVPLSELSKGESGVIISLDKGLKNLGTYAGMGIAIGAKVKVLRVAPLGDPVVISVHGSELSLRKAQLRHIRVKTG